MSTTAHPATLRLATVLLLGVCLAAGAAPAAPAPSPFAAFDNGVGRDQHWPIAQQAETLAALGYDGIGYSGVTDLAERLRVFAEHDLTVFSLYVPCRPAQTPAFAPEVVAALDTLAGTSTMLLVTVNGKTHDAATVRALRDIADRAQAVGVRICLYPHYGFYVATTQDALRVAREVKRRNVGVAVNLCHELRAGNGPTLDAVLDAAAPYLFMVSINGADVAGKDWDRLIQPLGRGDFDTLGFLRKLHEIRYSGPVALQCYGVPGDQRENLRASLAAWKRYTAVIHSGG